MTKPLIFFAPFLIVSVQIFRGAETVSLNDVTNLEATTTPSDPIFVPINITEEEACRYHIDRVYPLNISITFTITKFLNVDDTKETVSVEGVLTMQWFDPCIWVQARKERPNKAANAGYLYIEQSYLNKSWPVIFHRNSDTDWRAIDNNVEKIPPKAFADGTVEVNAAGRYTSRCPLDHSRFPFDQQQCVFDFQHWESEDNFNFTGAVIVQHLGTDLTTSTIIWNVDAVSAEIDKNCFYMGTVNKVMCSSRSRFFIKFSRKYQPYVFSIFIPCICLSVIQLTSIFIPCHFPERPAYAVTILLALAIFQQSIGSVIPAVAQTIYIVLYTSSIVVIGGLITVYCAASCGYLWHTKQNIELLTLHQGNISPNQVLQVTATDAYELEVIKHHSLLAKIKFVDYLSFLFFTLALVVLHIVIFYVMLN